MLRPEVELRPWQQTAVDKLVGEAKIAILDEMGTGKTVMGIAIDDIRRKQPWKRKKTLIISLAGAMVDAWAEHFEWMTYLTVVKCDPKNRPASWKTFVDSDADVFIVHWDALRLMPELATYGWLHVIADEVHKIQHRKTAMAKSLKKIQTAFSLGLSGTPTTGRPDLLWSALNWLYPKVYRSYWKFYKKHVDFEIIYPQGYHMIVGPLNEKELQEEMSKFTVRRLLRDVQEMPPVLPPTVFKVDLLPEQRKAYNDMKDDMVAWVKSNQSALEDDMDPIIAQAAISKLGRLIAFACAYARIDENGDVKMSEPSSKLDLCMELIENIIQENNKVVVFASSRQLIELLNRRLEAKKIEYITIHGNIPQTERGPAVKRFQEGTPMVCTGTIAAGGVGITLTAAHHVIFLQRDWSPALNMQAISRLDRMGQEHPVAIIDIVARNTVELEKNATVEKKWSWIKKLLGDK